MGRVVHGAGTVHPGFWGRRSPGDWISGRVKLEDPEPGSAVVPQLWLGRPLTVTHLCRCWFGKEPGDLVDYIYQGPIILVLLVGGTGLGWVPGRATPEDPASRGAREGCGLERSPHTTLCAHHPASGHLPSRGSRASPTPRACLHRMSPCQVQCKDSQARGQLVAREGGVAFSSAHICILLLPQRPTRGPAHHPSQEQGDQNEASRAIVPGPAPALGQVRAA